MRQRRGIALSLVTLVAGSVAVATTPVSPAQGAVCLSSFTYKTFANSGLGAGDDEVLGVYVDGSNVYAATSEGLSISTNGGATFDNKTTSNGLVRDDLNGVYADGLTIYAATNDGLSISSNGGDTFPTIWTTVDGLPVDDVNAVSVFGAAIYMATDGGLSVTTNGGATFTNYVALDGPFRIEWYDVYADGENIYGASEDGLYKFANGDLTSTPTIWTTSNSGLGDNNVRGVFADGLKVYAATDAGLSISTDGGATFDNKTSSNGLGDDQVNDVYADGLNIYAATGGGLSISTDGGATFTNYSAAYVKSVYADSNRVYAGTSTLGLMISADCSPSDSGARSSSSKETTELEVAPAPITPPISLGSAPKASTVPTPTPLTVQDTRTPSSLTLWRDDQRFGGDVSPTDDSVVVSAEDIEFSLSLSDRLGLAEFDSLGNLSTFGPTDLTFLSSGLYPGSPVQVFFGQQGDEVGRAFVGPDGSVQLDVSAYDFAAGSEIPVGPQRVQITTYDANGSVVVIDFLMQVGQPPIRPMLDPESGQLPALGTGIATGSSGGKASPVDVLWLREQGILTLGGESWSVSLENLGQQGAEGADSDSFPSMVLGSESLISGNGLLPGSTASVWMYPGEILLGQIVVDENGEFTISYLVDSRVLAPGSYTLQVHGIGLDGLSKSINVGIEVTSSEGQLSTGYGSSLLLTATIAAMGLVVAGGFLWFLIARRRRGREDEKGSLGQR